MRKRIVPNLLPAAAAAATLAVAGCGGATEADTGTKIVAAIYPLAFIAQEVSPAADVSNVTPAGAEPHDLELTSGDVATLAGADLVLFLGNGFQPALEKAVSGKESALDLLEGLELIEGSDEHGEEAELDPHVWLDPMRLAAMAERVAEALGDPHSAAALVASLEELDREFRDGLSDCERDVVVTSHAAFGYLADAYGLRLFALAGLSPEAEPSPRALEALIEQVKAEDATTVFFETLTSPEVAETVAREAGVQTAVLNPLEGLTEEEAADGADYFSVMRANLDALRKALECT